MGITTQHCFNGTSITAFATESAPNGTPMPAGCDDMAPPAPAGVPAGTDDAVGACATGQTELQDDVENFIDFMTFLAPPSEISSDAIAIAASDVFTQSGAMAATSPHVPHAQPGPQRRTGRVAVQPVLRLPGP